MSENTKPVIAIVPGMMHQPAHYEKVAQPLRERGYEVLFAPLVTCGENPNPALDHVDDARAIQKALLPVLDQGKKVVLVAHSYGGLPAAPATEGQTTAERSARGLKGGIEAFITVTGYAFPVRGKSVLSDDNNPAKAPFLIYTDDGLVSPDKSAKELWYHDVSEAEADAAWSLVLPYCTWKSLCAFPHYITADISVPKTYVIAENDKIIPPFFQEMMTQWGKYDHVLRIPSGHFPSLSMPENVVEILVDVAEKIEMDSLSGLFYLTRNYIFMLQYPFFRETVQIVRPQEEGRSVVLREVTDGGIVGTGILAGVGSGEIKRILGTT